MKADQRLKTWPGDLDEIRMGRKRSEVRRCDDRRFRVGEVLELYAWDPETKMPIAFPSVFVVVTHIERMAGPLLICGLPNKGSPLPLAILSFEVAAK